MQRTVALSILAARAATRPQQAVLFFPKGFWRGVSKVVRKELGDRVNIVFCPKAALALFSQFHRFNGIRTRDLAKRFLQRLLTRISVVSE